MSKYSEVTVQVDFFKTTGKWYEGGKVTITKKPHLDGLKTEIYEKQNIVNNPGQFHMVVSDLPENMDDPDYKYFFGRLYFKEEDNE